MILIIEETLDILSSQLRKIAYNLNEKAISRILYLINEDTRIVITGAGRSGLAGKFAGNWLSKIANTRVICAGDENIPFDFGKKDNDLLFAISASGETYSVIEYANTLREKGAKIIGITSNTQGKAWKKEDIMFEIKGRTKNDFKKEEQNKISKRTPLGTLSEFSTVAVLTGLVEAHLNNNNPVFIKKFILKICDALEEQKKMIRKQKEEIDEFINILLQTRGVSNVVLQGYGRMHRIAELFASRLYQIKKTDVMILGSAIVKKIRKEDLIIILSLSGQIKETLYATKVLNEQGLIPFFFLSNKKSEAQKLINKQKLKAIYIYNKTLSMSNAKSWFKKQFRYEEKKSYPSLYMGEFVLMGFLEGVFACLMEKIGIEEKNLLHIKYIE